MQMNFNLIALLVLVYCKSTSPFNFKFATFMKRSVKLQFPLDTSSTSLFSAKDRQFAENYEKNTKTENDAFLAHISPDEFEELDTFFKNFDTDKSGGIDVHEALQVLEYLKLENANEAKAQEMMQLVDTDGNGVIDFREFCKFVALIKKGDARVMEYRSVVDKLGQFSTKNKMLLEAKRLKEELGALERNDKPVVEVDTSNEFFEFVAKAPKDYEQVIYTPGNATAILEENKKKLNET